MAKRKPVIDLTPRYYVYYDNKSGKILSVTNEKSAKYEHGIEVLYEEAEAFLTGKCQFIDYRVGYKRLPDNTTVLGIILADSDEYSFRNNVFEWITEGNEPAVLTVEWNLVTKAWTVMFDDTINKTTNNIMPSKLVFFVTSETDLDFLIRTIFIDTDELMANKVVSVPFEHSIESNIKNISVSTKLVFSSYNLKVVHD